MNILHINQDISTKGGGVATFIRDSATAMHKMGHCVSVATAEEDAPIPISLSRHVYAPEIMGGCSKHLTDQSQFDELIRRYQIDVAHVHEVRNLDVIKRVSVAVPTIVHLHNYGMFCPGNDLFHAATDSECNRTVGWVCAIAAYTKRCNNRNPLRLFRSISNSMGRMELAKHPLLRFVVGSEFLRDRAIAAGLSPEQLEVVIYAADGQRLDGANAIPPNNIDQDYILFVGRLAQSKGISYLLQAFEKINAPNTKLVIVGDGIDRSTIEWELEKRGLADRTHMLGWRSGGELTWLFRNCRVLVVPSVWPEVFGIVGLEAMAAGKPVVASRVGGIPEWLSDNYTGYLVPPANADALADRIQALLSDDQLAKTLGKQGRDSFHQSFTIEDQAIKLLRVYRSTITDHQRKSGTA